MCALDLCRRIPLETSMIFGDQAVSVGERVTKDVRAAVAHPSSDEHVYVAAPRLSSVSSCARATWSPQKFLECASSFIHRGCFPFSTGVSDVLPSPPLPSRKYRDFLLPNPRPEILASSAADLLRVVHVSNATMKRTKTDSFPPDFPAWIA